MKRLFTAFLSMIIITAGCAYYNTFFNAKRYYKKAYHDTKRNLTGTPSSTETSNYNKAIEKALTLIQLYPDSKYIDDALLLLGKSYYYTNEHRKSRRKFLELKVNYPKSEYIVEARIWLAKTDIAMDQFEDASGELNDMIIQEELGRHRSEVLYLLGTLHERKREFERAVQAYEDALSAGASDLKQDIYYAAGADYDTLGLYDKSLEHFRKLQKSNPPVELEFEAAFRIAKLSKKQRNIDDAINQFQSLLGDPRYSNWTADVELEIADCLFQKSEYDEAIRAYQDITHAYEKKEEAAHAFYQLGLIYESVRKDYERALDAFKEVKPSYGKSVYVDSAEVKKRDLQRLQALRQVISMAYRGEDGEVIVMEEIEPDSMEIKQALRDSAIADSLKQAAMQQQSGAGRGQPVDPGMSRPPGQDPYGRPLPADQKMQKSVENPEFKKFKKEELDKNLLFLGELYLFRFQLPDSAAIQYQRLVREFPESPYTAKALYNLGYISESVNHDTSAADTCYRMLVNTYPKTVFANAAREKLGLKPELLPADSIFALFSEAEQLLFSGHDPHGSIQKYGVILSSYPEAELAPKALMAMARISESELRSPEMAFTYYDSLLRTYPNTRYAQFIQGKVEAYQQALKEDTTHTALPPDSASVVRTQTDTSLVPVLQAAGNAKTDSLLADARTDSSQAGAKTDSLLAGARTDSSVARLKTDTLAVDRVRPQAQALRDSMTEPDPQMIEREPGKTQAGGGSAVPKGGVEGIRKRFLSRPDIKSDKLEGIIAMRVSVDHEGKVLRVNFLEKAKVEGWNTVMSEIVHETIFDPAVKNGRRVASTVTLLIPLTESAEKNILE